MYSVKCIGLHNAVDFVAKVNEIQGCLLVFWYIQVSGKSLAVDVKSQCSILNPQSIQILK